MKTTIPSLDFNLAHARRSMVGLQASIPADAFTAPILGERRGGSGIVIRDSGLVLTIGYLITEADEIWLTDWLGRVTPGYPLAVDQATGFGLVQPLGQMEAPALPLGSSAVAAIGDPVVMASGGDHDPVQAEIVAKREFSGPWEYLLDEAIYTAPAHPFWGGAGLLSHRGELIGVGSLHLEQEGESEAPSELNMVVPIDLLKPVLDDMAKFGRSATPPRPWLGLYCADHRGRIVVAGVVTGGPGDRADVRRGDEIVALADTPVENSASLYRKLWAIGPAGVDVALRIERDGETLHLGVKTVDRTQLLRKPRLQ